MKNKTVKKEMDIFKFLYRYGTIMVTFLAIIFFSATLDNFMNFNNITNVFRSVSIVGLIALAITMSLTVDGFDLSVGATAGFASVIAAKIMVIWEMGPVLAIIIPLIVGVLIGCINAFLIIKIGISDMLTTLSMMFVLTGISITFQSGSAIYNYMPLPNNGGMAPGTMSEAYLYIGQGKVFGIPFPVIIMLTVVVLVHIFLNYTKHGRYLYMVGGNEEAAQLSGIPVNKYKLLAYVLSGFIAALGGLVLGARLGSGEVNAGATYLMDAVAAAYIGFSVLGIGKPNAFGTLLGALLMGILLNGLIMMDFPYYSQDIVKGIVLILGLGLTYYKKKTLERVAIMDKYFELTEESVVSYIKSKMDYFSEDAVYVCEEIGDGNLNLVFRVKDTKNDKSIIVKQALPYVRAAGEDWPLDINRGEIETRILKIEYDLTDGLVPEVYFFDKDMFCMVMEDLSDYVIMRYGLLDGGQYPDFADHISDFLVKTLLLTSDLVMDKKEKKESVKQFINPELCEITEDLVYTEPFNVGARNNMEDFLVDFHYQEIVEDKELAVEVAKLKVDFMTNAQSLLHGDLHTGSIFVNEKSTKVIDPEFAFYGPMAYDIGALIANLIMNYISTQAIIEDESTRTAHSDYLNKMIKDTVDLFRSKSLAIWDEVVTDQMAQKEGFKEWFIDDVLAGAAGVAGCEMIRRTVGFAHVKDIDSIPDDAKREKAKKENLILAKALIKGRSEIITGDHYMNMMDQWLK